MGKISTGIPGVMGLRFDNTGRIWYVNKDEKKVMRIDNNGVTNVTDIRSAINYSIYPNPATNVLHVDLNESKGTGAASILIYDIIGKEIYRAESTGKSTTINSSSWAKGVYSIMISYKGAKAVSKVVIQ